MAKKDEHVVDASVVVKWFLIEPDSAPAVKLRDDFATSRVGLIVPDLLFYEVMNALRFSKQFGARNLALAARSLSRYRFGVWRPMGRLLELSSELSIHQGLTVYDSCYIALAQRTQASLITEDIELLSKFPKDTMPLSHYVPRS